MKPPRARQDPHLGRERTRVRAPEHAPRLQPCGGKRDRQNEMRMGVTSLIPLGLQTRTPHAGYARRAKRNRRDRHQPFGERLARTCRGISSLVGGSRLMIQLWRSIVGRACRRVGRIKNVTPPPPAFILPPLHWREDERRDHGREVER